MAKYDEQELWYDGKLTRRRWLGLSAAAAGAIGATVLVPSPWRAAFGQAKPYKIGTLQPLSGAAAAGGKTALVGSQMAVDDRSNMVGSVSGGCIEGAVVMEAQAIMAGAPPKLLDFGITNEQAWDVGLACGGKLQVYVEAVE